MMMRFFLFVMMLAALPFAGQAEDTCGFDVACPVGDRSYHIKVPDDWDGVTPMPVMLHFHGWQRQGSLIVKHQRISAHTRRRGVLLIAPNGAGRTWDFWTSDTDDVPFAASVIEDVAKRYPIDRERLYVSGYSYGAAMAWRYVCQNGNDVAALMAISGTLRTPEDCPQAPREVRQVYGFDDTVMRLDFGPGQNESRPVDMWVDLLDCQDPRSVGSYNMVSFLTLDRREWVNCAEDHKITLDLHPGGHFIPHGWIGRQLDELLGREPTYP